MDYFGDILLEAPTAFYRFDEYRNATVFDFSVHAHNLTAHGTPSLKQLFLCSDWPSGSIKFNTNGDYVDGSATPFITLGALTVIGLLKPNSIAASGSIIRCGENDNMLSWAVEQSTTKLRFKWYNSSLQHVDSSAVLTTARHWFAITRNSAGTVTKIYIDGALTDTLTTTLPVPGATAVMLQIGGQVSSNVYAGVLDELAIFANVEMPSWKLANLYAKSIRKFPSDLPQVFDQKGYDETEGDSLIKFQPVYGPVMPRPRTSSVYTMVTGLLQVSDAERDEIENFYVDTLEGGSLTFEASFRGESTPILYKFMKPPSYHDLEGGEFEANFNVIALP